MTFLLILGTVAGLYMLALLFRLASYALPVYTGIGCAFLLLRHDYGHLAAIAGGLSAGISTLLLGQYLIALADDETLSTGWRPRYRRDDVRTIARAITGST